MRDVAKQKLRQILEQHGRAVHGEAGTAQPDKAAFEQGFERAVADIIRPIMLEAQATLKEHGVASKVLFQPVGGGSELAKITFEFLVQTEAETHGFPLTNPALTFAADTALCEVLVHENAILPYIGGHAGIIARRPIEAVTEDLVEQLLLDLSQKILSGASVT